MFRFAVVASMALAAFAAPARQLGYASYPKTKGFQCCVVSGVPNEVVSGSVNVSLPLVESNTDIVYACDADPTSGDTPVCWLQYTCSDDGYNSICDQWLYCGTTNNIAANGAIHMQFVYQDGDFDGNQPYPNAQFIDYTSGWFPKYAYLPYYQEMDVPSYATADVFDYAFTVDSKVLGYNPCVTAAYYQPGYKYKYGY